MSEESGYLLCGVERRVMRGREFTLVHLQDEDLRVHTLSIQDEEDLASDVGKTYIESANEIQKRCKRFYTWRCEDEGVFSVRGHTISYHKWFGMQCWLHVEIKTNQGPRNIAVLAVEAKMRLYSKEQVRQVWGEAYRDLVSEYPLGLMIEVEWDRRKKKHTLKEGLGEYTPLASVGAQSSGELSTSPAR